MDWQRNRPYVLLAAAGAVIGSLGWVLVDSAVGLRQPQPFQFPDQISLSGWQAQNSQAIANVDPSRKPPAAHRYDYQTPNQHPNSATGKATDSLTVQAYYVIGNLQHSYYWPNLKAPEAGQQPTQWQAKTGDRGTYGLFVVGDRAYLSTCLTPQGHGTLTMQDVLGNADYRMGWRDVPTWAMENIALIDRRCLWSYFSLPLGDREADQVYPALEAAWLSWQQQWQGQFPQP